MTLKHYYEALNALSPPKGLSLINQLEWLEPKIYALRAKLTPDQLSEVLKDQKRFQDKMSS